MLRIKPVKRSKLRRNNFSEQKKGKLFFFQFALFIFGVPTRIRTAVTGVKGPCPRPLDDGDVLKAVSSKLCLIY